jgi:hypothetical protein
MTTAAHLIVACPSLQASATASARGRCSDDRSLPPALRKIALTKGGIDAASKSEYDSLFPRVT